jgi:hypothetical protein
MPGCGAAGCAAAAHFRGLGEESEGGRLEDLILKVLSCGCLPRHLWLVRNVEELPLAYLFR